MKDSLSPRSGLLARLPALFRTGLGLAVLLCLFTAKAHATLVWIETHDELVTDPGYWNWEVIPGHYDGSPSWVEGTDGYWDLQSVYVEVSESYEAVWAFDIGGWYILYWQYVYTYEWETREVWVPAVEGHWTGGDWIGAHSEWVWHESVTRTVTVPGHWEDDGN